MSDKIIYLVPEPGVDPALFTTGYGDHSVDIPLVLKEPSVLAAQDVTYEMKCGFKTYAPAGCGGMFLMPRSSTSLLWPKDKRDSKRVPNSSPDIVRYQPNHIALTNTIGYIDASYRGEWMVRFSVTGRVELLAYPKLFQAVPLNTEYKFLVCTLADVPTELLETARGEGGFGSTDGK